MSVLVEQQDETINVIETTAAAVEKDTEVGCVCRAVASPGIVLTDHPPLDWDTPRKRSIRLALRAGSDGFALLFSWSSSL